MSVAKRKPKKISAYRNLTDKNIFHVWVNDREYSFRLKDGDAKQICKSSTVIWRK